MLYEKATRLPPFSTPQGIMFLLVFKMRQSIEFQKSRVIVQALMSQKGAQDDLIKKAYEDMREAYFPYDKNQRKAELKKMKDAMTFWVNHGPVVVEAQADPRQQKRTASRLAQGQKDLSLRVAQQKAGQATALDPFTSAIRRPRKG